MSLFLFIPSLLVALLAIKLIALFFSFKHLLSPLLCFCKFFNLHLRPLFFVSPLSTDLQISILNAVQEAQIIILLSRSKQVLKSFL